MQQPGQFFDLSDDMLDDGGSEIPFHKFVNGAHKFRLAPPFDQKTLFFEEWIHWMKTVEGYPRAITCGRRFYNTCPLCERKTLLQKHRDKAELMGDAVRKQQFDNEARAWGAKPTVLWNIFLGEDPKVLQISSNGHVELLKKVKFWWNQKRINITDPRANYLMYVERTGEKSTTRYTFEVIDSVPPANLVILNPLINLMEVYKPIPLEEMVKITQTGYAPSYPNSKKKVDPNAPLEEITGPMISQMEQQQPAAPANQPFQAPPAYVAPQPQFQQPPQVTNVPPNMGHPAGPTTPHAAPQQTFTPPAGAFVPPAAPAPANQPFAAPPTGPTITAPAPVAPPVQAPVQQAPAQVAPTPTAPVSPNQEAEIANMLAALNGGK